jgi:hypothetical protein
MQVDLGSFFDSRTGGLLEENSLSKEFYVVPPKWNHPRPLSFKPFSVPYIELRRRISSNKSPGYVEYRRGGKTLSYNTTVGDEELQRSLDVFENIAVRFRTFDDSYSPCRHYDLFTLDINFLLHDTLFASSVPPGQGAPVQVVFASFIERQAEGFKGGCVSCASQRPEAL